MSGIPVNTKKEQEEVFQAYMRMLAIKAQNQAVITRAMKAYDETGSTPIEPVADTTTADEYFKNTLRLKADVAQELTAVTKDAVQANSAVSKLSDDELQYVANDIKRITEDLQKYKFGLPEPALTAYLKQKYRIFTENNGVSYGFAPRTVALNRAIENNRIYNAAPIGLFDPIQSPAVFRPSSSSAFNNNQSSMFENQSYSTPDWSSPSSSTTSWTTISPSTISSRPSTVPISPIVTGPSNNIPVSRSPSVLPTRSPSLIAELSARLANSGRTAESINAQSDELLQLSPEEQREQIIQQELAIKQKRQRKQIDISNVPNEIKYLDKERFLFSDPDHIQMWWYYWHNVYPNEMVELTKKAEDDIEKQLLVTQGKNKDKLKANVAGARNSKVRKALLPVLEFVNEQIGYHPAYNTLTEEEQREGLGGMQQYLEEKSYQQMIEERRRMQEEENARMEQLQQIQPIEGSGFIHNNVRRYPPTLMRGSPSPSIQGNGFMHRQGINRQPHRPTVSLLKQIAHNQHRNMPGPIGRRISGGGLKRVSISIDDTKGLLPTQSVYVPFGKYIISVSHLDKNRLKLRDVNGKSIGKLPEIGITSDMSRIVKRLIDGGNVDDRDIETLSSRDKEQLMNILKECKIADRIHMNADLDKREQDLKRFVLLQGEIFAGNDNVSLIKEFKMLILKLSKQGFITTADAQESLMTLASAGY